MKTKNTFAKILALSAAVFMISTTSFAQEPDKLPISVVVEVIDPSCSYSADGQINLNISGGFPPYYVNGQLISGTTFSIGAINNGDFEFYISDDYLTNATVTASVTPPQPLQITATVGNATSFGGNDGFVDLTVTNQTELSYFWSAPGMPDVTIMDPNTEDQSGLAAGIYAVTITEPNGCETYKRYIIGQPDGSIDPSVPSFVPNMDSSESGNIN